MMTRDVTALLDGDVDSESVEVRGRRIHYLTAGSGARPLVLLHGGIIDAAHVSWGDLIGPLSEDATVYAPDLPGYGASEMPADPVSMSTLVESVAAFIDELSLEDPVVAGISMGGGVAIGLALTHPERVSRVVALDAFALGSELPNGLLTWLLATVQVTNRLSVALMRWSRRYTVAGLASLVSDPDSLSADAIDRVVAEVKRPGAGAAFRAFRASEVTRSGYRTDYSDRVADLSVPVRYVHGADDDLLPSAWSERAADRTPDSELFALDGCGHLPTLEKPDRVRDLVAGVL